MEIGRRRLVAGLLASVRWAAASEWISLFDGRNLGGWKLTPYNGPGPVTVQDGAIRLGRGRLTGVRWGGEFPKTDYEIRFEAARLDGNDFLSITFPVGASHCEWVNGGWGGEVVGLSNLDGYDASENETSTLKQFEQGRWYRFRLAVSEERIQGWIDDAVVIDVEVKGRQVELRFGDSDLGTPLGFSAYAIEAGVRKIAYRRREAPRAGGADAI
ncbi:MAG TPA: DUF1080 domain-containing protein [Bryobacteraceae bacterium]|nr:DUF1080 domain-containing protein [Bryobacterales bacterium]HRJ20977.1 DUF1080 domain-containing protein [Bryobacteraceae bacterium]